MNGFGQASWRGFGVVFAALLIAVLALAPSLDNLICPDDAPPLAAATALLDGEVHAAAISADHAPDDQGAADVCIHGHCHHGASLLSAPIGALATLGSAADRHELVLNRITVGDRKFDLDRPPRA